MKNFLLIICIFLFSSGAICATEFTNTEKEPVIKETYQLKGTIEYDDNPVETIYLDENIEIPQVNIPKRSLTLPVGVLNITSNTNTTRSALARSIKIHRR